MKLKYVSRVYNGKEFVPELTVKIGEEYLKKDEDFTVAYSGNKNVGIATVTVTGDGDYKGSAKATFRINPKPAKLKMIKIMKKAMKVTWYSQAAQTSGYQIMYSLKKGKKYTKTVTIKSPKATSKVIKKLKAKKVYYVKIRTFKKVGKTPFYSTWSRTLKYKKINEP